MLIGCVSLDTVLQTKWISQYTVHIFFTMYSICKVILLNIIVTLLQHYCRQLFHSSVAAFPMLQEELPTITSAFENLIQNGKIAVSNNITV